MVLDAVLNPALGWLLYLQPFWAVFVLSLIVSGLTVVIYKYATNQNLMKQLKDEMKAFQKEIKELKDQPEKAMEVQKKAMETNMKYMSHSLRPTLITFLPIILLFGWVSAHFAYEPLQAGTEFTVTVEVSEPGTVQLEADTGIAITGNSTKEVTDGVAIFTLKGDAGEHTATITSGTAVQTIALKIGQGYAPVKTAGQKPVKQILIGNKPLIVMNLFGWKLGWLGTYIIFSIVFSMALRRILKVF